MSQIESLGFYQNKPQIHQNKTKIYPKQKNYVSFGMNEISFPEKEEKNNKNTSMIKTATNIAGVVAWLFVVGYSIKNLKLLERKAPENVKEAAKTMGQKALREIEKKDDAGSAITEALEGCNHKGIRKFFQGLGEKFQNAKMNLGSELFTNLLYAFGTLIVMPAVVLFSPIGKKNSTKEDKHFAVLRQPLSVAATLGMQFTFDKLIGKYVPEVLKQNKLEDASILDQDGKIKLFDAGKKVIRENFEKIKYNTDAAKDGFKALAKAALSEDEIKEMFTKRSFESESSSMFQGKLKDLLNIQYKENGLNVTDMVKLLKGEDESFNNLAKAKPEVKQLIEDFKTFVTILDRNEMAVQKSKTWVNVIAASAIGCTFLNVIYGKFMKSMIKHKKEHNDNNNNEIAKEVK